MEPIIIRTAEQDLEFALQVHRLATDSPKKPIKEAYYALKNPKISEFFPDLSFDRLQKWCMKGQVGKMGEDGKYYVTLSEIEYKLFNL